STTSRKAGRTAVPVAQARACAKRDGEPAPRGEGARAPTSTASSYPPPCRRRQEADRSPRPRAAREPRMADAQAQQAPFSTPPDSCEAQTACTPPPTASAPPPP